MSLHSNYDVIVLSFVSVLLFHYPRSPFPPFCPVRYVVSLDPAIVMSLPRASCRRRFAFRVLPHLALFPLCVALPSSSHCCTFEIFLGHSQYYCCSCDAFISELVLLAISSHSLLVVLLVFSSSPCIENNKILRIEKRVI